MYKDGLHLLHSSKSLLINNFIENINNVLKIQTHHPHVSIHIPPVQITLVFQILKPFEVTISQKYIIGYLNNKSLRNKIIELRETMSGISLDSFTVSETKLGSISYTSTRLHINEYEIRKKRKWINCVCKETFYMQMIEKIRTKIQ